LSQKLYWKRKIGRRHEASLEAVVHPTEKKTCIRKQEFAVKKATYPKNEDPWPVSSAASQVFTLGCDCHGWNLPT
jgi:hypothetical protein